MSLTPLRGRGRPFKFISELTNPDQTINTNGSAQVTPSQSPSQANNLSHHIAALTQNGQVSQVSQASPVSQMSQVNRVSQVSQTNQVSLASTPPATANRPLMQGPSQNGRSPVSEGANPPTNPTTHVPGVQDEQSLSLAVEMAAVNQAIIALSGQTPIAIKAEKPDEPPTSTAS